MDNIISLHTIARRYFIDRLSNIKSEWLQTGSRFEERYKEIYEEINKKNNYDLDCTNKELRNDDSMRRLSDEVSTVYPILGTRKEILEAILIRFESLELENVKSLSHCKELIQKACHEAKIHESSCFGKTNEEVLACNSEKEQFYDFFNNISDKELGCVDPLFYRKVLPQNKIHDIKSKIGSLVLEDAICFKDTDVAAHLDAQKIREILMRCGIERLYEINTGELGKASYMMDILALNPFDVQGFDIYWCTDKLDWLIEKNHEDYYHFYGYKLVQEVKESWNDWEKYVVPLLS